MSRPFRVTLVHPCVGRYAGMKRYIRTWKMEPLAPALLAGLLPPDVERRFYDDRLEPIPFDEPTDLVAISVETYTAKRAYQIATEYRRRGVPVVMGGFHATLAPEETERHCESLVVGEAESVFEEVIDDWRRGEPKACYRPAGRPPLDRVRLDRSIFAGKRYLPIGLVEYARGCRYVCDFCAVQSFFAATQSHRPVDRVVEEVLEIRRPGRMIFFVDDNLCSDLEAAKELMRALVPLRVRWVSQTSIDAAFDDDTLDLMRRSGCMGVLVGFESLRPEALAAMKKGFNLKHGGAAAALDRFRRFGLRVYGTFVFGYDADDPSSFGESVRFAREQGLFIAAFNHITPFPGTPLYRRLQAEGRLLYEAWWLDDRYRYNMVPFRPAAMSAKDLEAGCLEARRAFYSWRSIAHRMLSRPNRADAWVAANFVAINAMHQRDVEGRSGLPLGDASWTGSWLLANSHARA